MDQYFSFAERDGCYGLVFCCLGYRHLPMGNLVHLDLEKSKTKEWRLD